MGVSLVPVSFSMLFTKMLFTKCSRKLLVAFTIPPASLLSAHRQQRENWGIQRGSLCSCSSVCELDSAPLARKASILNWAFFLYLEARSAPSLMSSFAWIISCSSMFSNASYRGGGRDSNLQAMIELLEYVIAF